MTTPRVTALLLIAWVGVGLGAGAGAARADAEQTLRAICGQALSQDTIVREQGGNGAFGDCTIALAGVRLQVLQANLVGRQLEITGTPGSKLLIVGTRLRARLSVGGSYARILLTNSLFQAALVDVAAGPVEIRNSTVRPGVADVATGAGRIEVASTKFLGAATFVTQAGGADLRFNTLRAGVDASAFGTGDLAFLSNSVQGPAGFRGDQRVVVAASTFEPGADGGGALQVQGDLELINDLTGVPVEIQSGTSLLAIGNTFDAGRPTVTGTPASCITIDNDPGVPCP